VGQHFSDYLKTHDRTKDLSSAEFGRLVGISKSAAADILAGRSTPPPGTLRKIADAFPDLPHSVLQEVALRDTPVDLGDDAYLLSLKQRALLRAIKDELLEASGKKTSADTQWTWARHGEANNVVRMPQSEHVRRAAYDPPHE